MDTCTYINTFTGAAKWDIGEVHSVQGGGKYGSTEIWYRRKGNGEGEGNENGRWKRRKKRKSRRLCVNVEITIGGCFRLMEQ